MAATQPATDLHLSEWVALVPLAGLMLVMGVAPNLWLRDFQQAAAPPPEHPVKYVEILQPGSNAVANPAEAR